MGYTFEITATLSLGLTSETAIAARRPAPPPPTRRTSWEEMSMPAPLMEWGVAHSCLQPWGRKPALVGYLRPQSRPSQTCGAEAAEGRPAFLQLVSWF